MTPFEQNLAIGRRGEEIVRRLLLDRGIHVVPIADIRSRSGGGPKMDGPGGSVVLPDFLTFRADGALWAEAKTKSRFSWHRGNRRWETGIDGVSYDAYLDVMKRTGEPVRIYFLHLLTTPSPEDLSYARCPRACPAGAFSVDLKKSPGERRQEGTYGRGGMVYWAHRKLDVLGDLVEIKAHAVGRPPTAWDKAGRMKQQSLFPSR